MAPDDVTVQVVYSPGRGSVVECSVVLRSGATLHDALEASGMLNRFPGLVASGCAATSESVSDVRFGIWGKLRPLDFELRQGDRVEVYRPLLIDPMEARRRRQKVQRATRKPSS